MGEYYSWVNVDKREFLTPGDFEYGSKFHESMWPKNECLCALRELLSKEWAGDHVLFMGDETPISADTENETLRIIYQHTLDVGYPGDANEAVIETYRNISCLFKAAEAEVRPEIMLYLACLEEGSPDPTNEYGVEVEKPFEGLFLKHGQDFKYTINHTKKVFYSSEKTKVYSQSNCEEYKDTDPLPFLMCYGRMADHGDWLGDIIGVSDDVPVGYTLLEHIYVE